MSSQQQLQGLSRRLQECEDSARWWAERLLLYAQTMQTKANTFATISVLLSAISTGTVFAALKKSTNIYAVLAVAVMSLASALVTALPKIKKWAECSGQASMIASALHHAYGQLLKAEETAQRGLSGSEKMADVAIATFEDVHARIGALRPFPSALREQRNAMHKPDVLPRP